MKISYEQNPSAEDLQLITDGLSSEAHKKRGLDRVEYFCFFLRDKEFKIKGGIHGVVYYGCMYVSGLWVEESCRKKGYGQDLMLQAEELAGNKDCNFITLNTMDFEAREFYESLGYIVEFERKGYLKSSICYSLRKNLDKR